jgi:hypothetical protein
MTITASTPGSDFADNYFTEEKCTYYTCDVVAPPSFLKLNAITVKLRLLLYSKIMYI